MNLAYKTSRNLFFLALLMIIVFWLGLFIGRVQILSEIHNTDDSYQLLQEREKEWESENQRLTGLLEEYTLANLQYQEVEEEWLKGCGY